MIRHTPSARLAIAVAHLPRSTPRQPFAEADKLALLRATLAVAAPHVAPSIERSRWGKPEVPGNPAWVSLSHSGSWLAAAAAPGRVGIDVQTERTTRFQAIARRLEWPPELQIDDAVRFAALWTLWEAAIKAWRRECRDLFARHAVHMTPGTPQVRRQDDWLLVYWQPGVGVHASVLVHAPAGVELRWTGTPVQAGA